MRRHPFLGTIGFICGTIGVGFESQGASEQTPSPLLSTVAVTEDFSGHRTGVEIATVDVSGIPSMDGFGSPNNVVINLWVGPHNEVSGVGWDVVLQTLVPNSWLASIGLRFTNSAGGSPTENPVLRPGAAFGPGGPMPFASDTEIVKLRPLGYENIVALADGIIRLEFFDDLDDSSGVADGLWVSGVVRFQTVNPIPPIPTPMSIGLLALIGLAPAIARRR